MNDEDETPWSVTIILFLLAIGILYLVHWHMESNGYHQVWSDVNHDYIWVDKDGKP
jgi:hypothetical protein